MDKKRTLTGEKKSARKKKKRLKETAMSARAIAEKKTNPKP